MQGLQVIVHSPQTAMAAVAMHPAGGVPLFFFAVAAAVLSSNCLVHQQADGQLIRADAALGLAAHGLVKQAAVIGAQCQVFTGGFANGYTGLTAGVPQWLGTAGQITATVPTGDLIQWVGRASTSTQLSIDIQPAIETA